MCMGGRLEHSMLPEKGEASNYLAEETSRDFSLDS